MSYETKKANKRRKKFYLFKEKAFVGKGIDIGCGRDLLNKRIFKKITSIEAFDSEDGNAQHIDQYREKESYDFVYSSNCLEHMDDPVTALKSWYSLVKVGGYLVFTVPDEDLYEQGHFPSKYNPDHKWTFTLYKTNSWSPKSVNLCELVQILNPAKVHKIGIVDTHYDYSLKGGDQTRKKAEAFIEVVIEKKQD
jgi:SAM-dependent methyltransferase